MELKDVILSTLAEMEDTPEIKEEIEAQKHTVEVKDLREMKKEIQPESLSITPPQEHKSLGVDSEELYLKSIRERMLVLFEGFQAPNNTNIEAKVDMTLNFLEYVLATIDSRIEMLEKGKK